MHDRRLSGMVVMLLHFVHRVVGAAAALVHADHRAVSDGTAVVSGHLGTDGKGLERFLGRCHGACSRLRGLVGRRSGHLACPPSVSQGAMPTAAPMSAACGRLRRAGGHRLALCQEPCSDEPRIASVAAALGMHFEERAEAQTGKAMVLGMSRDICVHLYDEIVKQRPGWHSTDPRRARSRS